MNAVHYEEKGRCSLNNTVTSRQAILEASRQLALSQGWSAISMRSVAAACGVAVGSLYNYFPSKAELLAATLESVWEELFQMPGGDVPAKGFAECIGWLFSRIRAGEEKYPGFFTLHAVRFAGEEKAAGRRLMSRSLEHIRSSLLTVLKQDPQLRPGAFGEALDPEGLVEFALSGAVSALLRGDEDCRTLLEVIRRSIY